MSTQRTACAFQLLLTICCLALAREVSFASDRNVLVRLPFDLNRRAVCVAGTVNGSPQTFLIQTGASHCMYSTSLRRHLGRLKGKVSTNGYNGRFPVELYAAPDSRIGNFSIHRLEDNVLCCDLDRISDIVGTPIAGIIGMDVLKQHVVGIDFDKGEFSLFRALPNDTQLGSRLPLSLDDLGIPTLNCSLAGEPHSVRIDTGSDITGAISLLATNKLFTAKTMRTSGLSFAVGKRDSTLVVLFRVDEFTVADFAHSELVFAAKLHGPQLSSSFVGLNYLKRFNLVFDFPRQRVYLRKSRSYAKKDYSDIDGMLLTDMEDGRIVVVRLMNDGRAWHLGVRTGDELVRVAGEKPRNAGQAIQLIGMRERELEVQFRRDTGLYSVTLPY